MSTPRTYTSARRRAAPPADSPWLSPREAAAYLGVGVDLIYEAVSRGELRHWRPGKSTIRIKRAWLDQWAESRAR